MLPQMHHIFLSAPAKGAGDGKLPQAFFKKRAPISCILFRLGSGKAQAACVEILANPAP